MSVYIPLGKIPASAEERKKILKDKISKEEALLNTELNFIQKRVVDFLTSHKGYLPDDIKINVSFKIDLPDISFIATADIIIQISGKNFCLIKCVMNSMESWERHSVAFCRAANDYCIPFAIITDGDNSKMLNSFNGSVISEGLESIPSRKEAEEIIKNMDFIPYPLERLEKEKRILYAFDAIRCTNATGNSF